MFRSLRQMPTATQPLEKLAQKAGSLYTLPTVAMEVVRLTGRANVDDRVDTQALKETIEGDPALTAKVLRVVNSSMFGLSREVSNLTQALALLGVNPLKLLVLGFSLPDELFAGVTGQALERYWTVSLTRAVSARSIASDWFADREVCPDDAFIAGLLCDLGTLVLIQELGEPYLRFLSQIEQESADPLALEQRTLGFDRRELTAALLKQWKLPQALVDAAAQKNSRLADDPLVEVVALADILTDVVGDRRIAALPELMERGEQACGLTKEMLHRVVEPLQQEVDAAAAALRVQLAEDRDYTQVLSEAHTQMAELVESSVSADQASTEKEISSQSSSIEEILSTANGNTDPCDELSDDELSETLLAESHELRIAMRAFLRGETKTKAIGLAPNEPYVAQHTRPEGAHPPKHAVASSEAMGVAATSRAILDEALAKLVTHCRNDREELSLALLETAGVAFTAASERHLLQGMAAAREELHHGRVIHLTLADVVVALMMPGVDRREAIRYCERLSVSLEELLDVRGDSNLAVHAGVATVAVVPNRFQAAKLVQGAERALSAARSSTGAAVKSIEVY